MTETKISYELWVGRDYPDTLIYSGSRYPKHLNLDQYPYAELWSCEGEDGLDGRLIAYRMPEDER